LQKGKQLFPCFKVGIDLVKMKKPRKKKSLMGSWEGPYLFVGYLNQYENTTQHEEGWKCIIEGKDEQ
jgi:hypothetical protein